MKKLVEISFCCECRHRKYDPQEGVGVLCKVENRIINNSDFKKTLNFPEWCPLESKPDRYSYFRTTTEGAVSTPSCPDLDAKGY